MIASRNSQALTFIELLVVIVIIGVLTVFAVPRFRGTFDSLALESFAKDVYYLAQYLRDAAITEHRIYALNINKEKGAFQAVYQESTENPEWKPASGRFGKTYYAPERVIISLDPADRNSLNFYPDGTADSLTLVLQNQQKKEISLVFKGVSGAIQVK